MSINVILFDTSTKCSVFARCEWLHVVERSIIKKVTNNERRNNMLTLYIDPDCPFCQRVLQVVENLRAVVDTKDVTDDEVARAELIDRGGVRKVPFMFNEESGESMYESEDIIEYIRENGVRKDGKPEEQKPRVHISNSVCESCEG